MKGLIFTHALTYGGAAVALFNPYVGLLIYVCFALIRPNALWGWAAGMGGNYSVTIGVALGIGWLLNGLGSWRFHGARAVVLAMFGFWAWLPVATVGAEDQVYSWEHVLELSKIFLACTVALTLIDSTRRLRQLAWVIVLAQGYLAYEFNVQYYERGIIESEFYFGGLDNNGIAITMVTSTGLAFFLGLHESTWWRKALALGLAALMAHVVLFSMSRGGMLALVVTGAMSFLLLPKRPGHYVAFLLAVVLVLRLAGNQVREEFFTSFAEREQQDASAKGRMDLWKACGEAMLENPITGLGPRCWPLAAHRYGFPEGKAAHTTWLQVGAETGIPGFVALLAFYLILMARLWPLTRERRPVPDPWLRPLARMVIAALTGFMVSAQFVSCEGVELPYFIAMIGAGALKLSAQPPEAIGMPAGAVGAYR